MFPSIVHLQPSKYATTAEQVVKFTKRWEDIILTENFESEVFVIVMNPIDTATESDSDDGHEHAPKRVRDDRYTLKATSTHSFSVGDTGTILVNAGESYRSLAEGESYENAQSAIASGYYIVNMSKLFNAKGEYVKIPASRFKIRVPYDQQKAQEPTYR